MTNKEKAKVEAIKILEWVHGDKTASPNFVTDTITRLLDEKDQQFKEYLEEKLVDIRKENSCGPHGVGFNQGEQSIIKEIINEFFKD